MLDRLRIQWKRLKRKGFVGPRYRGIAGKIRFAAEDRIARREFVWVLYPQEFARVPAPTVPELTVIHIPSLEALEEYRADLEDRWYPGLIEGWHGPFRWGEQLFMGFQEGRPVSFTWVQVGTPNGTSVHWGKILEGEYRTFRSGVAPGWRGKGINTRTAYEIIQQLFADGGTRIYGECTVANVPSARTIRALGFRCMGRLEVLALPGLRNFVRWRPGDEPTPPEGTPNEGR